MSLKTEDGNDLFARRLDRLDAAQPFAKSLVQPEVLQSAQDLFRREYGLENLYRFADRFQASGLFDDSPWDDPSKLQPHLVIGTLKSDGTSRVMEILSELRMLAIAEERYADAVVSPGAAKDFLNEVLALNLGVLFSDGTETGRIEGEQAGLETARKLFRFLINRVGQGALLSKLVNQIHRLAVQRPITVNRIVTMLNQAKHMPVADLNPEEQDLLTQYLDAVNGPTPLSREHPQFDQYRREIQKAGESALQSEAGAFSASMARTGLVAPQHAIFVRCIAPVHPELIPAALGLNRKGEANFEENQDLVLRLIKVAIHPATAHALYGLARILDKGVLSFPPVIPGLERLVELDIQKDVAKALLSSCPSSQGLSENSILVAGVLSVLGQPLGVGQGLNPTCQSARGISLWAQHAAGYLLGLIARAARDGDVEAQFEGKSLHSRDLRGGLVTDFDKMDLDPVSIVLVPHLDRLYNEMMRMASFRGEDPHKWVNPAFYGNWIPRGFRSAVDAVTGAVTDFGGFIRLFYATHHPDYNGGHGLVYPNPVGIFITNIHGRLLGFHAISIQRVVVEASGTCRVYFYNPNDNSSQNWGQGISPTVMHHGEIEGESSLPIHEFTARLYAFHYNPYEQGDAYAVPEEIITRITELAKASWGRNYAWSP